MSISYSIFKIAETYPDSPTINREVNKIVDLVNVIDGVMSSNVFNDCDDVNELRGMMRLVTQMYSWQADSFLSIVRAIPNALPVSVDSSGKGNGNGEKDV